jgi:NAD(P)-dependent dehydrogenase (short-subunit alcohol dehydrogenase family)
MTASRLVRELTRQHPERLRDRTAIVTGGYSGIGLECVKALTAAGVRVTVPARDTGKAHRNLAGLPGDLVQIQPMDLMDPASIDSFAALQMRAHDSLDWLVGCAGIMAPPLRRDARGYESQFSVNHLGHFQLAVRLAQSLAASSGHPRVVLVSSRAQRAAGDLTGAVKAAPDGTLRAGKTSAHPVCGINFDDPNWERTPYVPMLAYAQSKTANALCALEADRRWRAHGIRAFSVHPGLIPGSGLGRHSGTSPLIHALLGTRPGIAAINAARRASGQVRGTGDLFKTPSQGAGAVLWCVLSPTLDADGGQYCEDCRIARSVVDPSSPDGALPWAADPDKAARLWVLSERLTGAASPWG